jgi:N-acetylglucosaminyldiphosphoundecaprenol N-acetyl-beta-D-mannosaminyltransferase
MYNTEKENIVEILGIPFHDMSYLEATEAIHKLIISDSAHQVVLANAHTLNLAYSNLEYQKCLQQAAMVLRDGIGVKLASILAGQPLCWNFVGTDFIPRLLAELCKDKVGVFLFGAKPGVAQAAARHLQSHYPPLAIVGCEHGYLPREEWDSTIVSRINCTRPHILLVALGNPLQEQWIAKNLARLDIKVAIGVGALFDYLAGEVSRAPMWMRRIGCEWLYRLVVEPRRLWRRYLIGNFQFLYRVMFLS